MIERIYAIVTFEIPTTYCLASVVFGKRSKKCVDGKYKPGMNKFLHCNVAHQDITLLYAKLNRMRRRRGGGMSA